MKTKRAFLIAAGIAAGFVNGFFGGGGGAVALMALRMLPQMEDRQAHAMCVAAMLPVCAVSTGVYLLRGQLPESGILLQTMAGTLLGGMLGAKLLGKLEPIWLMRLFAAFLLFSSLRMIG